MRVALAQVNPTVGDIRGNRDLVTGWIASAKAEGAEIVLFPEMVIAGYPPDDLLLRADFLDAARNALDEVAQACEGIVALVGFPERLPDGHLAGADVHSPVVPLAANSLALLASGSVEGIYRKQILPNYGVFDERRVFQPGLEPLCFSGADELEFGLTVCEDIWIDAGPALQAAERGANVILNASASPYAQGKGEAREGIAAERARETGCPVLLCNLVGGQDDLVFDGRSVVCDASGEVVARGAEFEEELLLVEVQPGAQISVSEGSLAEPLDELPEIYSALTLGLSDYARKNGFTASVLGLSGGIDSALVAMLAADALGAENVTCVVMPSPHSSPETQQDARDIAAGLGCSSIEIPIESTMTAFQDLLDDSFGDLPTGLAEENLQARIRGNLIMGLSNKFGWLPLATGNKSEMAVGYSTLYGDMAGGFAPIKDVPKTLVYRLTEAFRKRGSTVVVPDSVMERAPTAELRPGQLDSDSLPDYAKLDEVLALYVERDMGREAMIESGLEPEVVDQVIALVDRAEYKRRQSAPGTRISSKAFGRDRRLPITNRY